MTNRQQTLAAVALIVLIVLVILGGFALQRGIITMDGWKPGFNFSALITVSQPSLDREITFSPGMSEEVRTAYEGRVAEVKATLAANPADEKAWRDLAVYYKMGNDLDGAVDIWEYLISKNPNDGISLHNLGEHYFHAEKNYRRAEDYYRKSIRVMPTLGANYTDLHEMYKYVYKQDTTSAVDILEEAVGAVDVKDAVGILSTLALYQKEKGNIDAARAAFEQALTNARTLGNSALVKSLELELSRLR